MKIVADANIPSVAECFSSIGDVELLGGRQIAPDAVADADVLLVRSITPVTARLLAGSMVKLASNLPTSFSGDMVRRTDTMEKR